MRYVSRLAIVILFTASLSAQENIKPQATPEQPDISALLQKIRDLEDRMLTMEGQIRQLKEQQAAAQPVPNPASFPAGVAPDIPKYCYGRHGSSAAGCFGWRRGERGQSAEPGHKRDRRLYRGCRTQSCAAFAFTANARIGSRFAGDSGPLCPWGFLHFFWRRGGQFGGRLHHLYSFTGRFCG